MEIAWHCEADPFCRRVLEKHWPGIPTFDDVCTLNAGMAEGVDVLCGGFPCQDISLAGKGAGIDGARSGLWSEFARLIGEFRPRYVLVENVSALLGRGLDRVLSDLSALGFDAEWDCIPASAVGAPHRRDRLWVIAYSHGSGLQGWPVSSGERPEIAGARNGGALADAEGERVRSRLCEGESQGFGWGRLGNGSRPEAQWATEPDVGRVAYGVPARVDRLRSLGNALVPQVAQWIGERIVSYEASLNDVDVVR